MMNGTFTEGRLTADPKPEGEGDNLRVSFTVAVPRDYKPKGAKYPESDFYFTIARRKKAEEILRFFKKGDIIQVHSRYTQYENRNKERQHLFNLIDWKFPLGGSRKKTDQDGPVEDEDRGYVSPDLRDDDLPF